MRWSMLLLAFAFLALLPAANAQVAREGSWAREISYAAELPWIGSEAETAEWSGDYAIRDLDRLVINVTMTNSGSEDRLIRPRGTIWFQSPLEYRDPSNNQLVVQHSAELRAAEWTLTPGESHVYVVSASIPKDADLGTIELFPSNDCAESSETLLQTAKDFVANIPGGQEAVEQRFVSYSQSLDGDIQREVYLGCDRPAGQGPLPECVDLNLETVDPPEPALHPAIMKTGGAGTSVNAILTGHVGAPAYAVIWSEAEHAKQVQFREERGFSNCQPYQIGDGLIITNQGAQAYDGNVNGCIHSSPYHLLLYYNGGSLKHTEFQFDGIPDAVDCANVAESDKGALDIPGISVLASLSILVVIALSRRSG